jgi:hypothetical protein
MITIPAVAKHSKSLGNWNVVLRWRILGEITTEEGHEFRFSKLEGIGNVDLPRTMQRASIYCTPEIPASILPGNDSYGKHCPYTIFALAFRLRGFRAHAPWHGTSIF